MGNSLPPGKEGHAGASIVRPQEIGDLAFYFLVGVSKAPVPPGRT